MVNNWTEYKIGSIDSSNDTYADIVHLTQAQYDALENPDPDTLYSTPDNVESWEFKPENEGTPGQVVTKTTTGYKWNDWIAYYTEAEYECLPDTKLTDGINYWIYDWDWTDNTLISLVKNWVSYCIPQWWTKYWYVDFLIVWWWGSWNKWINSWNYWSWGWWWGWFIECFWVPINNNTLQYWVVVWWWWLWWGSACWSASCFFWYQAYWWKYWMHCDAWPGACWWNSWASSVDASCHIWWSWAWINCSCCRHSWWWGGWAWWDWCSAINEYCWWDWWIWKASSMSWELKYYWWWGGWAWCCYCWIWWCWWWWNATGAGTPWCDATYYWWWGWAIQYWSSSCCAWSWCQWIVIIRYKTDWSCWIKNTSSWWCKYTCWDYTIHCFTNVWSWEKFLPVFK